MVIKHCKSLIIFFSLSVLISLPACEQTSRMDNSSQGDTTVPVNNTPESSSEITIFPKLGLSGKIIQVLNFSGTKYYNHVQIVKIIEGGSADKVGIKSGDLISLVEPFPGVQNLSRRVYTVKDVIRNLEHYEEGDIVLIEILSKIKGGNRLAQIFYVKIEASENTNDTTRKYIERPRTAYPRRQSNAEFRTWAIGLLESERYKKLLAGDNYGKQEEFLKENGFVDLMSTHRISGAAQFELHTNKDWCKSGHDEVNLFITASSPKDYTNHRINLGSIVQTAKNRCDYAKKANIFFAEKNGKIREKFSILKGSSYLYKSPSNSSSVPPLVVRGEYGPLFYNLSSGGLNAIYADKVSMEITRYIYSSFGLSFGQLCKSAYGEPDVIKSTTIASNQHGVTGSSERNIEVAPGFAKGMEKYQYRVRGLTSVWVSTEVNDFIKAYSCKSKIVRNTYKALIEFERNDHVK